jgi:hypothetical protein
LAIRRPGKSATTSNRRINHYYAAGRGPGAFDDEGAGPVC